MEMLEWTTELPDFGTIVLKGELPNGYPTETWLNGEQLERDPDGAFSWAVEEGFPSPIYWVDRLFDHIDESLRCFLLRREIEMWDHQAYDLENSQASRMRCAAFAQHGRKGWTELGCGDPLPIHYKRGRSS